MERGNTKQEKQQEDKGHDSCTMHKRKKALNEKCESSLEAEGRKFGPKKKKRRNRNMMKFMKIQEFIIQER